MPERRPGAAGPPRTTLHLLDEETFAGSPVSGDRARSLLAALAEAGGRTVGEGLLVDAVWGADELPANPTKALHVLVSRVRAQTAPEAVVRTGHGYRLGTDPADVDVLVLHREVTAASDAEARGDRVAARDHARVALALPPPTTGGAGHLALLREAAARTRTRAEGILGRSLSVLGEHEEALGLLEGAAPDDEPSTIALLRSLAAVHGVAAALGRYEDVRRHLADRLGLDPGPALRAVHAELLAADTPVRSGVRYDATPLVGRDEDLAALRAIVRDARVVSIVGPGGLGKTRLVHVLAREAEQPVVHVVELVGVGSPEDVVGEIGSSLGVRDSVAGRRDLTPAQRRDVRARIAQVLEPAPTLLVLDNCEHVVAAVADLVAFLVATCPRLRVVTTTRAPLAIPAERVFPLAQLDDDAATDLFTRRARAARPGVSLDPTTVGNVVRRLDGLPLAIELAAARVRAMSVQDLERRLDDRFALLRGGDRSAPDRHQTLLAVVDWSWNLLDPGEQRALRWLSVFHDGFSLDGAEALLGHDPLGEIQSLADQSLLSVTDARGTVRFRMLETVREFARMQLVGAGEDVLADRAQLAWACGFAERASRLLWSPAQVDTVLATAAEEHNLADCLRRALAAPDPSSVVRLLETLATFWTLRGENARVIALTGAVDAALTGWDPADDEVDAAVTAAAMVVLNTVIGEIRNTDACIRLIATHGHRVVTPRTRALVAVLSAQAGEEADGILERLDAIGTGTDREAAAIARMWAAHHRENSGDPEGAVVEAERGLALADPDHGPWLGAMLDTLLAALHAQLGRHDAAARHALAAIPVLDRLEADDDAIQTRSLLAVHAMHMGRLDEAESWIEQMDRIGRRRAGVGGTFVTATARAELALARGRVREGLELYRAAAVELAAVEFPGMTPQGGLEPWTLFGESACLTAYALHAGDGEGRDVFDALLAKAPRVLDGTRPHLDYPVAGLVLHALGAWGLLRGALVVEPALRLLVLAECFGYPRYAPTMSPVRTEPAAERAAPGLIDRVRAEYAGRTAHELLPEARAVLAEVPGYAARE